jgi:hypothetical protein
VRDPSIVTSTLEQRVQRLESLVQNLTLEIQNARSEIEMPAKHQVITNDQPHSENSSDYSDEEPDSLQYETENLTLPESSPNSYLSNARKDLEDLTVTETFNTKDAFKSFSKLSRTFTNGRSIERNSKSKLQDGRQYEGKFYIPNEVDQQPLMQGMKYFS